MEEKTQTPWYTKELIPRKYFIVDHYTVDNI